MGLILGLVPVVVKGCIVLQVSDLSGCDELDSGGAGSTRIYTSRQ